MKKRHEITPVHGERYHRYHLIQQRMERLGKQAILDEINILWDRIILRAEVITESERQAAEMAAER